MDELVNHLGPITRMRNDILHFGTQFSSKLDYTVTNRHREYVRKRIRRSSVSIVILEQMAHDLEKIMDHLLSHFLKVKGFKGDLLQTPWLYKPLSPTHRPRKRREHRPKR